MQSEHGMPPLGSVRMVRTVGLVLGLAIMAGLSWLLIEDRESRMDSARRQSLAMVTGVDRLLRYELRNLERAMAGVVAATLARCRPMRGTPTHSWLGSIAPPSPQASSVSALWQPSRPHPLACKRRTTASHVGSHVGSGSSVCAEV